LPEDEFVEVRTSRNRLKITTQEQLILKTKRIGIVGLSVGHAIAHTIALERICGTLYLSDFDILELSNVNRVRSPLTNLGQKKSTIIQREIAEIDPYIHTFLFTDGINKDNLDSFLSNIDLLVEVCDDIDTKIALREKSALLKIPVLMDTNDKGMIDVERFDLESAVGIFNGLVDSDLLYQYKRGKVDRLEILRRIINFDELSERMKLSFLQFDKTLNSWPQLASSINLGAGAVSDVARRILLGNKIRSGRYYIDIEEIIK
jgi:hypothetical protein